MVYRTDAHHDPCGAQAGLSLTPALQPGARRRFGLFNSFPGGAMRSRWKGLDRSTSPGHRAKAAVLMKVESEGITTPIDTGEFQSCS